MESDLRTPAARLRAGLDNLSATPPDPGARPLPRTTAGQPRPLGALLGGPSGDGRPASAVAESESAAAPRPERPRAGGGHRRRYVLRRKLEPLACWPAPVRQAAAPGLGRPAPAPGRQAHPGRDPVRRPRPAPVRHLQALASRPTRGCASAPCTSTSSCSRRTGYIITVARLAPLAAAGAGRRPGAGPAPAAAARGRGRLGAAPQPAPQGRRRAGRGRPAAAPDPPRARPRASRNRDSDSDDPDGFRTTDRRRLRPGFGFQEERDRWPEAPAGGSDASRRAHERPVPAGSGRHRRGCRPWAARALDRDREEREGGTRCTTRSSRPAPATSTAPTSAPTPSRSAGTWSTSSTPTPCRCRCRFDTLEQARTYVARTPGTLRIVEVTDDGERVPVDTSTP